MIQDEFGRTLVWWLPKHEQNSPWHTASIDSDDLAHFGYFYDAEKFAEYKQKKQKEKEEIENGTFNAFPSPTTPEVINTNWIQCTKKWDGHDDIKWLFDKENDSK